MSNIPDGTHIAINRSPHDTSRPSHFVVGTDADDYIRICPIGRDPSETIPRGYVKGKALDPFSIVTRLPIADAVVFDSKE